MQLAKIQLHSIHKHIDIIVHCVYRFYLFEINYIFAAGDMTRGSFVIIFISLLHLITATGVYYVTPDDDQFDINNDCPIDHECHTLQYYLLNTSKYFTSNTQLHFLQGNIYINDDIVIDSLHNFSIVGSGVNDTLIECSTPSLIAIINCTNTVIKNITTGSRCSGLVKAYFNILGYLKQFIVERQITLHKTTVKTHTAIYIFSSYSTVVQSVSIQTHGIFIINGLGNSTLTDLAVHNGDIEIFYINYELATIQNNSNHLLSIINFKYWGGSTIKSNKLPYIIMVEFWQEYYSTEVYIQDTILSFSYRVELIGIYFWLCTSGGKLVVIKGCQFLNNIGAPQNTGGIITVTFPYCHKIIPGSYHDSWMSNFIKNNMNKVLLLNSIFFNNTSYHKPSTIINLYLMLSHHKISYVTVSNCTFAMNNNFLILGIKSMNIVDRSKWALQDLRNHLFCTIAISNSSFIHSGRSEDVNAIQCLNTFLYLNGPLLFTNFKSKTKSIISTKKSNITFHGHIDFFSNNAVSLLSQIELSSMQFKENLLLNISNNNFSAEIFCINYTEKVFDYTLVQEPYQMCYFQYISDRGNLDSEFTTGELIDFNVTIHNTEASSLSNVHTTHCRWQPNSAFNIISPLLINQHFISDFDKWNDILNVQTKRSLCACTNGSNLNCGIDILGPIYPGQNALFSLVSMQNISDTVPISLETINYSPLQCTVPTTQTQQNVSSHRCSNITYTLLSPSNIMCELLLKQDDVIVFGIKVYYSKFYVKLLPCPPGFMFIQMRCQCDPILTLNEYIC